MKREVEMELRALLRQSGELVGCVSPEEESATATWLRDVERLTVAARHGLQPELSPQVVEGIRQVAARSRWRVRVFRSVSRIAATAAVLAVVAWAGWAAWRTPRRAEQLARMDNLLALLESAAYEQVAEGDPRIEVLAVRLLTLQDAAFEEAPTPPQTEPGVHPSTDSQSRSSRGLPGQICV